MIDGPDKTNGVEPMATALRKTVAVQQAKVLITLPWMKFNNPATAFAVAAISDKRRTSLSLCSGDSYVIHSRNSVADMFLASEFEWQLTIDDDMIFPFGDAAVYKRYTGFNIPDAFAGLNTLDRLLSHGKTLVGALYWGRNSTGRGMFAEAGNKEMAAYARRAPIDEIRPTRWVATGCLLVHRSVYEDIEKKFPRLARNGKKGGNWFTPSEHTAIDWIDKTRDMLSQGVMDGEKALKAYQMLEQASAEARANSALSQGEDVAFCVRAKQAGHQPYVDLGLCLGHVGNCVFGPANTTG